MWRYSKVGHVFTLPASSCHLSSCSFSVVLSLFSLPLSFESPVVWPLFCVCLVFVLGWQTAVVWGSEQASGQRWMAIWNAETTGSSFFLSFFISFFFSFSLTVEHFITETLAGGVEIGPWWEARVISFSFFYPPFNEPPLWFSMLWTLVSKHLKPTPESNSKIWPLSEAEIWFSVKAKLQYLTSPDSLYETWTI